MKSSITGKSELLRGAYCPESNSEDLEIQERQAARVTEALKRIHLNIALARLKEKQWRECLESCNNVSWFLEEEEEIVHKYVGRHENGNFTDN